MTIPSMNEGVLQHYYEAVPGPFIQDVATEEVQQQPIPPRFGLIDESPRRWKNLRKHIKALNDNALPGESFKLFFFLRHGQSYHNVGKEKYGSKDWKSVWGRLNCDDETTWGPDSDLTSTGVDQALCIRKEWEKELPLDAMLPDKIYTSPLTRALRTCELGFGWLITRPTKISVTVKENLREENGVYTYDKRRSLSYIKQQFPRFGIEKGFTEEDELWEAHKRESKEAMAARAENVLDSIFDEESSAMCICCTIHGGLINAFLSVIGRPRRTLPTGGVYPVIIRRSSSLNKQLHVPSLAESSI